MYYLEVFMEMARTMEQWSFGGGAMERSHSGMGGGSCNTIGSHSAGLAIGAWATASRAR